MLFRRQPLVLLLLVFAALLPSHPLAAIPGSATSAIAADGGAQASGPSRGIDQPGAPGMVQPAAFVYDSTLARRLADLEAEFTGLKNVEPAKPAIEPGHNAFMMMSAALVLFMTLPGLALFYGGLVRAKNVLSIMAQCMGIAGVVTILWWAVGYSLVFAPGTPFLGGFDFAFLSGVGAEPNPDYSSTISHNVFSMYQLMFAIITPAVLVGGSVERMSFKAILVFVLAWMFVVYFPLAHMVWGIDGFMNGVWNAAAGIQAIDFAGGMVVEMASGWSALTLVLILGKRHGFGTHILAPHSMVLAVVGAGILWVGWYGFNAGSALAADGIAAWAFVNTTIAAAVAGCAWPAIEWFRHGKPTALGFCSGIVGGLVMITPAAGFVTAGGAVLVGVAAGVFCYLASTWLKSKLGYDDSLDVFGVHGVAGTVGMLLTGLLASISVNPNLSTNLAGLVGNGLWLEQLKGMGVTVALAVLGTAFAAYLAKWTVGLRPALEDEVQGLDYVDHGEQGYRFPET